jgi:hypothetical protein
MPAEAFQRPLNLLLLEMLQQGETVQSYQFLQNMLKQENMCGNPLVLYYAGLTAWLAGQPGASLCTWTMAIRAGVHAESIQPAYGAISRLLYGWAAGG